MFEQQIGVIGARGRNQELLVVLDRYCTHLLGGSRQCFQVSIATRLLGSKLGSPDE